MKGKVSKEYQRKDARSDAVEEFHHVQKRCEWRHYRSHLTNQFSVKCEYVRSTCVRVNFFFFYFTATRQRWDCEGLCVVPDPPGGTGNRLIDDDNDYEDEDNDDYEDDNDHDDDD